MDVAKTIRVLFVEDAVADAELAERALAKEGLHAAVARVETKAELLRALPEFGPDLVITDYALPRFDGMRALRVVREFDPFLPVIVLTGSINEETAVECIKAGAADYVLKSNLTRLPFAIRDALERKQAHIERIRAEGELQQTNVLLNSIIENIPSMIFLKDARELRFVRFNRAGEKLLGYSKAELLGKNDHDFFPKEQADFFTQKDREALRGPGVVEIPEERLQTKDKGERVLRTWKVPILNATGQPEFLLGISEDVTEKQQAEEEHRRLEDELRQTQKMDAVGRLAGGVAHDFNNMLQSILGNTELSLEEAPPDSLLRDNLLEIRRAAEHSVELIRRMLAFARKQAISPRVLNLNETIAGMIKMLKPMVGENIELAWQPASGEIPVNLDPTQLSQILVNLLANARDAIPKTGKVGVATDRAELDESWCRAHPGFRPGCYALLTVSDTGLGMDQETLSHLFEPFYTTKEQGRGTGLGLATVYGIVAQNGGLINVYSETGRGTVFRIYFPLLEQASLAPAGREDLPTPEGGTETLLLVEDEPAILRLARTLLSGLGYKVLPADSPEKALRQAEIYAGKIHLLVTDVVMPKMSGRELRDKLQDRIPGLKCLFMSGYNSEMIARGEALPENAPCLQKPFTIRELARGVRAALEG